MNAKPSKDAVSPRSSDCVRLPDGRIGRVRGRHGQLVKVRVRRQSSKVHQFVMCHLKTLKRVVCPKGWMSPQGYARYVRVTVRNMHERGASKRRREHRHE